MPLIPPPSLALRAAAAKASGPPADASPSALALDTFQRQQEEAALAATVDELKAVVAQTRTAKGTIRQAKILASVLALRFTGRSPKESAKILGVPLGQVTTLLQQARSDADIDSLIDRVDRIVLPLAIDNMAHAVMDGDKDYSLELLKGRGIFRTHKTVEAQIKQTVLTLSVSMSLPDHLKGQPAPQPRAGSILGAPIDAELLPSLPSAEALAPAIITVHGVPA